MITEIQKLTIKKEGNEELTSVLQHIRVIRCSLGELWDPHTVPIHSSCGTIEEGISNLLPPDPYQGWEEVVP